MAWSRAAVADEAIRLEMGSSSVKTVVRIVVKPPADGGHHHQGGSK
jgi:hypothetical protein